MCVFLCEARRNFGFPTPLAIFGHSSFSLRPAGSVRPRHTRGALVQRHETSVHVIRLVGFLIAAAVLQINPIAKL